MGHHGGCQTTMVAPRVARDAAGCLSRTSLVHCPTRAHQAGLLQAVCSAAPAPPSQQHDKRVAAAAAR